MAPSLTLRRKASAKFGVGRAAPADAGFVTAPSTPTLPTMPPAGFFAPQDVPLPPSPALAGSPNHALTSPPPAGPTSPTLTKSPGRLFSSFKAALGGRKHKPAPAHVGLAIEVAPQHASAPSSPVMAAFPEPPASAPPRCTQFVVPSNSVNSMQSAAERSSVAPWSDSEASEPESVVSAATVRRRSVDPDTTPTLANRARFGGSIGESDRSPPFDPAFERAAESDADSEWEPSQPGSLLPHGRPRPPVRPLAQVASGLVSTRIPSIHVDGLSMDDVFRELEAKMGMDIAVDAAPVAPAPHRAPLAERRRVRRTSRGPPPVVEVTPVPPVPVVPAEVRTSEAKRSSLAYMDDDVTDRAESPVRIAPSRPRRPSSRVRMSSSSGSSFVLPVPSASTRRSSLGATMARPCTPPTPTQDRLPSVFVLPPTPTLVQDDGFEDGPPTPTIATPTDPIMTPRPSSPPPARKPRVQSQNALDNWVAAYRAPISPSTSADTLAGSETSASSGSAAETDETDDEVHQLHLASVKPLRHSSVDVDGLLDDLVRPLTPPPPRRDIHTSSALDALQYRYAGSVRPRSPTSTIADSEASDTDDDDRFADAPHMQTVAAPVAVAPVLPSSRISHVADLGGCGDLGIFIPDGPIVGGASEVVKTAALRHWRSGSVSSLSSSSSSEEEDEFDADDLANAVVTVCDRVEVGVAM